MESGRDGLARSRVVRQIVDHCQDDVLQRTKGRNPKRQLHAVIVHHHVITVVVVLGRGRPDDPFDQTAMLARPTGVMPLELDGKSRLSPIDDMPLIVTFGRFRKVERRLCDACEGFPSQCLDGEATPEQNFLPWFEHVLQTAPHHGRKMHRSDRQPARQFKAKFVTAKGDIV